MQIGFIARTPRGRICLAKAYEHLTPQHFKDAATNIQTIMEEFGKAIAAGYDSGFSKALKKESNLETMSTAITNATTL